MKVKWREGPHLLQWRKERFQKPEEILNCSGWLHNISRRNDALLIILVENVHGIGLELWGVLYDLTEPTENGEFKPLLSERLLDEPQSADLADWGYYIGDGFGDAFGSLSGKVFAVISALPSLWFRGGNDNTNAEVKVFDITPSGFVQRCVLSVAFCPNGSIHLALNSEGTILSILYCGERDTGIWSVYAIQDGDCREIFRIDRVDAKISETYFTADNDFVLAGKVESLGGDNRVDNIPPFARKIVIVPPCISLLQRSL